MPFFTFALRSTMQPETHSFSPTDSILGTPLPICQFRLLHTGIPERLPGFSSIAFLSVFASIQMLPSFLGALQSLFLCDPRH